MYAAVKASYSEYLQITFDERFLVSPDDGVSLADTMAVVIEGLRLSLYCIWPRAREIQYVRLKNLGNMRLTFIQRV